MAIKAKRGRRDQYVLGWFGRPSAQGYYARTTNTHIVRVCNDTPVCGYTPAHVMEFQLTSRTPILVDVECKTCRAFWERQLLRRNDHA